VGRGEQEVAGGGQERRITPAAEAPGEQSRGGRGARRKKGYELNQGLICKFREKQGPDCKEFATFKPVLKWRWSKK
jgi:hypothetical protein